MDPLRTTIIQGHRLARMKPTPTRCPAWSTATCVAVLLAASCFTGLHSQADLEGKEIRASLLNDVLNGLFKTVDFFASNYQYVNIDAVFCIRLCQGSLIGILEDCGSHLNCPQEVIQDIKTINDRLNDIEDRAIPYIQMQNVARFSGFSELMTKPFVIRYIPENISNIVPWPRLFRVYEGTQGDQCIRDLIGHGNSEDTVARCAVSDDCLSYMTLPRSGGYYLTHQVLYTMISELTECQSNLEHRILASTGNTLREHQRLLCGQVYSEARAINLFGFVFTKQQDLFMEQITFCGMLGFENFFKESWIPMVLNWQTSVGCYSNNASLYVTDGQAQRLNEGSEAESVRPQETSESAKRRVKRTEMLMHDGCLSHKTGVAISAIAASARYLVRELYTQD